MFHVKHFLDTASEWTGRTVAWLALAMVLMTFYNVMQRYLFNMGLPWEQELVRMMHGALFMLAAGYTLKHDGHVRVDVVYQRFFDTTKAWINLLGTLFLLIPVCVIIGYFSSEYVISSWKLFEGSNEYRGMPGIFLFKSCIWLFSLTLILQGISLCIKSIHTITTGAPYEEQPLESDYHG